MVFEYFCTSKQSDSMVITQLSGKQHPAPGDGRNEVYVKFKIHTNSEILVHLILAYLQGTQNLCNSIRKIGRKSAEYATYATPLPNS